MNLEIRWFVKEKLDKDFLEQLGKSGFSCKQQNDIYLCLPKPHAEFIGVKLSRGTFDIKYKTDSYLLSIEEIGVTGNVETWRKCSLDLVNPSKYNFQEFNTRRTPPIFTKKIRYSKGYSVSFPLLQVSPTRFVDQGVKLEIVPIEVNKQEWFSVAFECFGSTLEVQQAVLVAGMKVAFSEFPIIASKLSSSMSYPEWISTEFL